MCLITLFNAVAILCPYCDFIANLFALHALLMAFYLLTGRFHSQQLPILIYPDGIDIFTCPYNAECED